MLGDKEVIIRLFLSVVIGGLIGLERQLHRRAAGLRTHILVSLGSCLIMLTSMYVFDIYKGVAGLDPSRIAAGVITGVGFLGAGAIIREPNGIKGLTTAASLWVVSGIGLAIGCGFYTASLFTTALALIILLFMGRIEVETLGKDRAKKQGGEG
ncbi:MAG: MgtC/SapB family protein [Candidatus Omnitrophica bacterium]|jgi:putative Mg2+ transporter-C (MgtC) family protein|nr:MgtC/SapB family protein [Candidatus Omnitrophota bacterium]MDD5079182.1 MgtC/SapB family protein [Candidatus Omnitrophota bacterium]